MMTLIIIIAALIIVAALLLAASVRIRAVFDESEKVIRASYTLFGSVYDIPSKKVVIMLAGVKLFSFPVTGKDAPDAKKDGEKEKKEKKKKKKKKKRKFSFSDLNIEYLKMAKNLVGGTKIRELVIKISGGFTEPFYTGKMYGYYCAAKGMYPNLMSHVDFKPDFSSGSLIFEGKGLVTLRMIYIFRFVCSLLNDKLKQKFWKKYSIKKMEKKGSGHGGK
ncbi:MAG: hypothetical protein JRL30_29040 [Deltaproteobacteria bacterium]|nr:hypothetical protein [Deltaproteobacteria bacterium]